MDSHVYNLKVICTPHHTKLNQFINMVARLMFQGAGHNDVEMYTQYLERLKQFVSVELIN